MMYRIALFLMMFLGLDTFAEAQQMQPFPGQCDSHAKIVAHLSRKFAEIPTSLGLSANGHVLEVFATKGGETWTIVATAPEGRSCILAAGEWWQDVPIKPQGPKA